MFSKIICTISFVALLFTFSMPVFSAVEISNVYLEQLLTMDKDEVCSISEECALAYEQAEDAYRINNSFSDTDTFPIYVVFNKGEKYLITENDVMYVDSAKIFEDLQIPEQVVEDINIPIDVVIGDGNEELLLYTLNIIENEYNGYDFSELYSRIYVALTLNPDVIHTGFSYRAFNPDLTELWGDVTNDGTIDIYDVIEIAKHIMGMNSLTEKQLKLGDYNGDSVCDLYDAIEIAKTLM